MTPVPGEIEIRVSFERGVGDPTRVFRTMTGLIESAQTLDSHLALSIGASVRTSLVLQDVEAASLKAKLKTVVESLPDEALKEGEVKKVIGHFLVAAKHKILDWCGERTEITSLEEVKQLQSDVHKLAEQSDVKLLPAYAPLEIPTLLADITAVHQALSYLAANDEATLSSSEGQSKYNAAFEVSQTIVQELVTREKIASKGERIVKIKKPDYLGTSKWEFKYADRAIEAKILHKEWLQRFQTNQISLNPGDSLRVILSEEVSYGYDSEIVQTDYEVLEVLDILPGLRASQPLLT
jgi:hypothetical protein